MDEVLVGLVDGVKPDEESNFPSGRRSLPSYPLKEQNSVKKDTASSESRRRYPCDNSINETPIRDTRYSFEVSLKKMGDSLKMSESVTLFKGPESQCDNSSVTHSFKRLEINDGNYAGKGKTCITKTVTRLQLQHSFPVSGGTIKRALERSSQEPELIGDYSRPFVLPLVKSRHKDLKYITSDTLAKLLEGEYKNTVDSYTIVDCRYPHEFNFGHIKGAINVYTEDQILKEFVEINKSRPVCTCNRNILVFYCEFSRERGPELSRILRKSDRKLNRKIYPALHYPEMYVLNGGYKEFFDFYSELCEQCAYRPMSDPKHEVDRRYFPYMAKFGDSKTCCVPQHEKTANVNK